MINIKSLRKDYHHLTMLERLSLADNALARDDETELTAIVAASPMMRFSQVDYLDLLDEITKFRLCNLIVRLSYIMQFDFFCQQAEIEILKNKSNLERKVEIYNNARLSAYLYVRATDSWKTVNNDLGLRPNFEEDMSEFLFCNYLVNEKDETMRKTAFSEDEVKEYCKDDTGEVEIQTLDDEIKAIKEALNLPTK